MAEETDEIILVRLRYQLHLNNRNGGGLTKKGLGPPTPAMLGLLNGKLQEIFAGDDDKRISLLHWLWRIEKSSKELTFGQVKATLDWLIDQDIPWARHETYVTSEEAEKACHAIIALYCREKGQMKLF